MGLFFFVFWFPEGFYTTKKSLEKTKIQKKTKENQKTLGTTKTNTVFKGFRPTLGYVFCFLLSFFVRFSLRFSQNQKNNSRKKQKYKRNQRKPKNIRNNTKKNKVFKGFRPTLGYVFVFLFLFGFPKVFTKPKQHLRKPKIQKKTKENQNNFRKN